MNLSENIHNAFIVIGKTYENVQKLIEYCQKIAIEKYGYVKVNDRFLRWKSDIDCNGWYLTNFIILFQRETDKGDHKWCNGPIYVIEINLYDNSELMPKVYLSKFEYDDIASWQHSCSPNDHWRFYYPLRAEKYMHIEKNGDITTAVPHTRAIADKYYWGLKKVNYIDMSLSDITIDNVEEKIFLNFDKLN